MPHALIQLAYQVRLRVLALLRWRTQGVKVLVFDPDGRLLLVRHRYGRSDLHMLPGGGIARGEAPAAAAIRELREETGCTLRDVTFVAQHESRAEGRRDTVHLFRAVTGDRPAPDSRELADAAFHALDALPEPLSPATRRRIEEWRGLRPRVSGW